MAFFVVLSHNLHVRRVPPAAPCCTPPPPLDSSYRRHTTDMALDDYDAQVGGSLDALTRHFNSGERLPAEVPAEFVFAPASCPFEQSTFAHCTAFCISTVSAPVPLPHTVPHAK